MLSACTRYAATTSAVYATPAVSAIRSHASQSVLLAVLRPSGYGPARSWHSRLASTVGAAM